MTEPQTKVEGVAADLAENLDAYRQSISVRMDKFEQRLEENTEMTQRVDRNTAELVGIFKSLQGAMRVLEFVGKFAKPLAAIVAAGTGLWLALKGKS